MLKIPNSPVVISLCSFLASYGVASPSTSLLVPGMLCCWILVSVSLQMRLEETSPSSETRQPHRVSASQGVWGPEVTLGKQGLSDWRPPVPPPALPAAPLEQRLLRSAEPADALYLHRPLSFPARLLAAGILTGEISSLRRSINEAAKDKNNNNFTRWNFMLST